MKAKLIFAAVWMTVSIAGSGYAQPLTYSLLRTDGPQPTPRLDGTIAYDPIDSRILLFGGQDSSPRNDLWAYSITQRRWEEILITGPKPPARFGHTSIFDPGKRRLVVFGGQAAGFFSDVWAFDTIQRTWQQLSAENTGPGRRYGHSAIFDSARNRMVISHGFTNSGRFDDTWAFDFNSDSWRDLSPSGTRPLKRCLHHAVVDSANSQMYLYGGCASGFGPCPLGDLWAFDLSSGRWTEKTTQLKPPPREHYGMGFEAVRGRLLIFGGSGSGFLNDTWEYDPRSVSWQQPAIAGSAPGPRSRHETTTAGDRGAMFFFGGTTASGLTNELWMLGPDLLPRAPLIAAAGPVNVFSGSAGAIAPGEVVSIFGSDLGPEQGVTVGIERGQLPTSGSGVSATFNDIPAPIFFAKSDQLNVQVPYELKDATEARLVVTVNSRASAVLTLPVAAARPGLFSQIWNQDGTVNSPEHPALAGSIVVLYATGQGVTSPASRTGAVTVDVFPQPQAPTSLRIGGLEAELLFRGQAPGTVGVMQLNARVPSNVATASAAPVVLKVGDAASQAGATISVR
ncbi:MAG: hypothetical protein H7Y20_16120 [Bryobacteraceae bacterium]|nr:hypothetical protein [Bryobacteraceae bacterium]